MSNEENVVTMETVEIKAFVPAKDFELSKRLYGSRSNFVTVDPL
jgi:hypothetical protein